MNKQKVITPALGSGAVYFMPIKKNHNKILNKKTTVPVDNIILKEIALQLFFNYHLIFYK